MADPTRDVQQLLDRQDALVASRESGNTTPVGSYVFDPNKPPRDSVWEENGWDFHYVPILDELDGSTIGWKKEDLGRHDNTGGGSGSGSSSSWSGTYVNDALSAASGAIQAFLTGQSLADARKLGAAEQFQQMAGWALPEGEVPYGWEEGGIAHQAAAAAGQKTYSPPKLGSVRVNPADLINAGQVPDEVMQFIDQLLGAADKGHVVSTGGSSSVSG